MREVTREKRLVIRRSLVLIGSLVLILLTIVGWSLARRGMNTVSGKSLFAASTMQLELPPETTVSLERFFRPSASFRSHVHSPGVEYDAATGDYSMTMEFQNGRTSTVDWIPPTKLNASVTAAVRFLHDKEVYEYRYRIANGIDSKQNLWTFGVFLGNATVLDIVSPPNWYSQRTVVYEAQRVPFVLWTTTAFAEEVSGGPGLIPGQSEEFILLSPSAPGTALCYGAGWALPPRVPDDWGAIKDPPGAPAVLMAGLAGVVIGPSDEVSDTNLRVVEADSLFMQAGWATAWDAADLTFTATRTHDSAKDRAFYGAPALSDAGKLTDRFTLRPDSSVGSYNGESILMFRPARLDPTGRLLVPSAVLEWIAIQGEESLLKKR